MDRRVEVGLLRFWLGRKRQHDRDLQSRLSQVKHQHAAACLQYTAEQHVAYELRQMAAMSGAQAVGPGADLAATALLEAFLTHARTLDSFLYGPGRSRREHDVYAEDYLNGWRQGVLGPDFQAISQRVMHLMCERDNIADWDVHQRRLDTAKAVLDGFDAFVKALDASGHAANAGWFKPALADAWNEYNLSAANAYIFERRT